MEPVLPGRGEQRGPVREPGDEQAHPAEVGDGVGEGHHLGQHGPRRLGDERMVGHEQHEREAGVERQAPGHRPPVHDRGGDQSAEGGGRGVLGVPVAPHGDREGVVGARRGRGRHGKRGRGPEPPPDRDGRLDDDLQPVVADRRDRDARSQVRLVGGQVGPLALRAHQQARRGADLHLDVQVERDGEDVEAGAEVRGGGGGACSHQERMFNRCPACPSTRSAPSRSRCPSRRSTTRWPPRSTRSPAGPCRAPASQTAAPR